MRLNPSHPVNVHRHPAIEMPRLTHDQMLAILCESGVPESDARRWVEREARLALDVAAS